ncbi:phage major capsid protein, partial [Geobacillus thermodenitrificans]|uniref:phage major capsid protein n=1 Tax=Geobacillus thermodenitrificans TaxID=33940 RepID=UPI001EEF2126
MEDERNELSEKKSKLEGEIAQLEGELEQLNSKQPSNQSRQKTQEPKGDVAGMNRLQVREMLKTGEYYKRSEVVEFYEKFRNLRAVAGGELTIPEVVVNRIMDIMGDYTTLYPLV